MNFGSATFVQNVNINANQIVFAAAQHTDPVAVFDFPEEILRSRGGVCSTL
ncbi:hypothetical protein OAJ57_03680 [Alphaproteobacteria bacterium]|nr:hypothetical protein [Alphaproteobacteria bacterium]